MVSDMPLGNAFWKEPKTKMEKSFPECVLIKPFFQKKQNHLKTAMKLEKCNKMYVSNLLDVSDTYESYCMGS